MCTVSFIPSKDKVFITSNRDEQHWRLPAVVPAYYSFNDGVMIYPKDGDAGGTWICLCTNGNAGVLLNGAFTRHERKARYAKSRGLIFLEIMQNLRPVHYFRRMSLAGIEAFTLIIWQQNNLYECRWDANERKHCRNLPAYRPYIWSSSTLYDEEVRKKRELWFLRWLNRHPMPRKEEIIKFHRFAGDGDQNNDLLMNRDGQIFTVSITDLELSAERGVMSYHDLLTEQNAKEELHFSDYLIAA